MQHLTYVAMAKIDGIFSHTHRAIFLPYGTYPDTNDRHIVCIRKMPSQCFTPDLGYAVESFWSNLIPSDHRNNFWNLSVVAVGDIFVGFHPFKASDSAATRGKNDSFYPSQTSSFKDVVCSQDVVGVQ